MYQAQVSNGHRNVTAGVPLGAPTVARSVSIALTVAGAGRGRRKPSERAEKVSRNCKNFLGGMRIWQRVKFPPYSPALLIVTRPSGQH